MPFTTNQALFEFFANEHNLLLTESEMHEIIRQVKLAAIRAKTKPKKDKTEKPKYSGPARTNNKKTREWEAIRAELKIEFEAKGITFCEMCGSTMNLSFAHSLKRRHIIGDQIREVALLCVPCHQKIEILPEAEMTAIVRKIIAERKP